MSDALGAVAPLWAVLATLLVYISYLTNASPALTWIGLALACLPYPLRLVRRKRLISRTPFDIPIILLLLAAIVGLWVSPERTMSLGAFQCILALVISYYTLTSDEHQAFWMKGVILALPVAFVATLVLILLKNPHVYTQTNSSPGSQDTNHGLALQLSLAAALLFGVAAFGGKQRKTRMLAAIAFLSAAVAVFAVTSASLKSLVAGDSISGRIDLWRKAIDLFGESTVTGSPVTGLGLGGWARAYYGTMDLWHIPGFIEVTHPHNAYIEFYSDAGLLGALALAFTLVIGAKLSLDIIRSPRSHPWYGWGIGVILACIVTLLVGMVESAPVGAPYMAAETYYYVVCPIPCTLCAFLVVAHRLITRDETG